MFLGRHAAQLQHSNQLTLPPAWRQRITEGIYLTQGFDHNLLIFTPRRFEALYASISVLNFADPLARLLKRMLLGAASYVTPGDADTISLPDELIAYASLDDNVVIVGQGEYVEVWSSDLWQQQEVELNNAAANAQRFAAFSITTN